MLIVELVFDTWLIRAFFTLQNQVQKGRSWLRMVLLGQAASLQYFGHQILSPVIRFVKRILYSQTLLLILTIANK